MTGVIYEQPMDELTRVCLRLNTLFDRLNTHSESALPTLVDILNVLDRPDLKAKLTQTLTQYTTVLTRLAEHPDTDPKKVQAALNAIDGFLQFSMELNGKFGQALRDNEFLQRIRLHAATPGGHCPEHLPIYHHWLHQDKKHQHIMTESWLLELQPIQEITSLFLKLLREGIKTQTQDAPAGFYQEALDPQAALRILRVTLPANAPCYPEMSVGRHLINIHFYQLNDQLQAQRHEAPVRFQLGYGYL